MILGIQVDAYAHSTKIVKDYKVMVGWAKEPAILGSKNAIEIIFELATDYDKQKYDFAATNIKDTTDDEPKKSDTLGLSKMLEADIELGGEKTPLNLSEIPERPGVYYDYFTPKVTGIPSVFIYGNIKNIEFESKFRFEKVKDSSELDLVPTDSFLIPNWIKSRAGWWAEEQISDSDFVSGLEHLIKEKILIVPQTESNGKTGAQIPEWVKTIAGWWSKEMIPDIEFIEAIQFLIKQGIIRI